MEVPRLGVESELQLPAYTTAITTQDPSHICNLHHSSQQYQIPDPLREARDLIHILMDIRQISFHCSTAGIPSCTLNRSYSGVSVVVQWVKNPTQGL